MMILGRVFMSIPPELPENNQHPFVSRPFDFCGSSVPCLAGLATLPLFPFVTARDPCDSINPDI
jgi:hypothetical protein